MAEPAQVPYLGYTLYVVFHKGEQRRYACLVNRAMAHRTTISYARYLMAVKGGRRLLDSEHVDHENDDKLDDRIDNLQILSSDDNYRKYVKTLNTEKVCLTCPICRKEFELSKRRAYKARYRGKVLCCSRTCGGKYSHRIVGRGS